MTDRRRSQDGGNGSYNCAAVTMTPERFWWDGGADEVQKIRKMDQLTSSQQDAEMTDGCEANGEIAFGVFESCIYCSVCDCSTLHEALKEMASAKKAKER